MRQEKPEEPSRFSQVSGILLLLFSAFSIVSLFSFHPGDIPLFSSMPNDPALNKAGRIGAYLSGYVLFFPLGLSAWLVPILTTFWGLDKLRRKSPGRIAGRLAGVALVLFSVSWGVSLTDVDTSWGYFFRGGIVGEITQELLGPFFGEWGSLIFVFSLFALGVSLTVGFHFFSAIGRFTEWFFSFFRLLWRAFLSIPARLSFARPKRVKTAREPRIAEKVTAAAPRKAGIFTKLRRQPKKVSSKPLPEKKGDFQLPPLSLLSEPPPHSGREEDLAARSRKLEETLGQFGVKGNVTQVTQGPIVSTFEFEPAPGIRVSQITNLADDISLALKAAQVRLLAPIPGKSVVGVEVPNLHPKYVYLREVLGSSAFSGTKLKLGVALGKDVFGKPLAIDLEPMPHILIAGTTGSGKTVCINAIILSLIYRLRPDEVKFLMIDPKMVELSPYNGMPHLVAPVVTGAKKASGALKWVVSEMDARYRVLASTGVRDIGSFNRLEKANIQDIKEQIVMSRGRMPSIVVIIDELADLMAVSQKTAEDAITRLAQLSRAVGIHLVIATQRPSVDVITGVIKANLPYRISFQVSSRTDSRTVLDMNGAERLLGNGDMLFLPPGKGTSERSHGSLVVDSDVKETVSFLKKQRAPAYSELSLEKEKTESNVDIGGEWEGDDELFNEAVKIIRLAGRASTSMLQRRLSIGYARAARLLDKMEELGIIGSSRGTKPREVIEDNEKIKG